MKVLGRFLYAIYYWLVACPLFIISTIILSSVTVVACYLGFQKWAGYWPGTLWSRIGLTLFLCPIKVEGRENIPYKSGPFVVMANHQGAFDILMMYGYLSIPFRWVMKQELRSVPFMGKACAMAGFIFVDEKTPSSIKGTMSSARKVLSEGTSIFIFPEGSRTKDGKMRRFKKGGFMMAYELNVPIIPVTINGAFKALPRGTFFVRPTRLKLTIHPPVEIDKEEPFPQNMLGTVQKVHEIISSSLQPS
ncbi:lysophospholipid acyltransferase family protein [Porphyromonas circumdentaria]|uniref:1-acyl-sn-glycerol-3-phosphate acyltransferase n=1 Tax=Porphyromonas circumdentaria TaxID=29524 RepID=A0A1T4LJ61_9PORP|nr:lysophospholipid acyltransferase family protein [Porphyromonas circumdentaria]MBB6275238.1 1-acyl-sn-glycerol-3-phosphate acyltransferase [Porphyromonas circumdentaria]MDO4722983.1 lysophospholipid acyltransferase family protein [Porphyromonas circumdentaria]SJZ54464.1 1-acyl-sn-glycerol-3-phosphate acyltransferase [Porphyromonas circumdentaria]